MGALEVTPRGSQPPPEPSKFTQLVKLLIQEFKNNQRRTE